MLHLLNKLFHLVLILAVFTGAYQWSKPTPKFLSGVGAIHSVPDSSVRFLADVTYADKEGKRHVEQEIWDEIFSLIGGARHYVLMDMFLFNDFQGSAPETTRPLSRELVDAVSKTATAHPHMAMTMITDPINTVYGGAVSPELEALRKAGVFVIETELTKLPDPNLTWSAFWRPLFSWWGNSTTGGWIMHPFQANGKKVTLRSWLTLLNFKANHRKIIVADLPSMRGGEQDLKLATIVTSANPHDGSSAHGNVALYVRDGLWTDVINSERKVAELSQTSIPSPEFARIANETGPVNVQLLSERAIHKSVLEILASMQRGDSLAIAMFYLSDRDIVNAIADAANRGVGVRLILDPNKDAFGHKKNGIPNRPVAKELKQKTQNEIKIRWCDTHGEQCHAKLFMGTTGTSSFLMLGSANFTRRNIGNYNLETNIYAFSNTSFTAWRDAQAYFERIWGNTDGTFTAEYELYKDDSWWKSSVYRMMERTGLSSF